MPFGFRFWKKDETKVKVPLSEIPLFASLGPAELKLVETKIRRIEHKKGDVVYRIGEEPVAFYIILSGRFRVVSARGDTIIVLSQGDYFGESSILLGRKHSATIVAKNDGLVLKIDKQDFLSLLSEIPSLSLHLSRTLGHRLTAGTAGQEVLETKIVAILDFGADFEKSAFAQNLSALLAAQSKKKVILIGLESQAGDRFPGRSSEAFDLEHFPSSVPDEISALTVEEGGVYHFLRVKAPRESKGSEGEIVSLLSFLVAQYHFVLLDLPSELGEAGVKAIQQSDLIYFLTGEENRTVPKVKAFLSEFQNSFGFSPDQIRFILREQEDAAASQAVPFSPKEVSRVNVFSVLPFENKLYEEKNLNKPPLVLRHSDCPYAKTIRFLARELSGKLVGLVLGSGAAFGFAHVGVLRALEREKIPIDIIVGSSIGALIAGMWAAGFDSNALEQIAGELTPKTTFFKLIGFSDISLPHHGFFKGNQVSRFLKNYLKDVTFRKLKIPVKMVAANLFTGEEVVFDEGEVVEAIRASISIPGIFRPVRRRDQYLIDGGVVDPLPVRVLSRYGVKKIIAVNVLSTPDDHLQRKEYFDRRKLEQEEALKRKNAAARLFLSLTAGIAKRYRPNVFNVLMNTIQFLEYGIAEPAAQSADIVIHPVLHNSHWAEFYSIGKFVKCGEERTMEQMGEIKRLIEEGS